MTPIAANWGHTKRSLSTIPQQIATTGMRYVTEDANTDPDDLMSVLNIITANEEPTTPKIEMYPKAGNAFSFCWMV